MSLQRKKDRGKEKPMTTKEMNDAYWSWYTEKCLPPAPVKQKKGGK